MEFDWDEGNEGKNLKHGVSDWDIEEALTDIHLAGSNVVQYVVKSGSRCPVEQQAQGGACESSTLSVRVSGTI